MRNERVIRMDGIFTHSLTCSIRYSDVNFVTSCFVTNAFRNKNNMNTAITITNLLQTNINNNKLKDFLDLESFNAKLKPICRLQTAFSTETRVVMHIYLEIIKFNLYQVRMPRW